MTTPEKAKVVIKNSKKGKTSWVVRLLITLMLMMGVFTVAATITYIGKVFENNPIDSYEECVKAFQSKVQESYPTVCVTRNGQKFVQTLSEEEQKLLEAPSDKDADSEGKFCGGIAGLPCPGGYRCKLDGNYPDAGGVCQKSE